jgi:Ca2+-transporting ATPase
MAGDWYNLSPEAVLQRLEASPLGLSDREAASRLVRHGPNELVQMRRASPLRIFLQQFTNALVIVLIFAAAISAALGVSRDDLSEIYDSVLIVIIVILNAMFGFVQEYRAERSLEALKALAAPKAHVLRDGTATLVPTRDIVPGDVVVLAAGDRVPADARLLEAASLRVDEASLTGESVPVSKMTQALPGNVFLGDRRNMVYMGTSVDGGRATAVVVETGMSTELGTIAGLVQRETPEDTPLQRQLDRLGRQIGLAVLVVAGVIFLIGYLRATGGLEFLFLVSVGLAVAAIPEGLPAVVTISLALGLQRMIKRHALIRKLPAVESLGAATVICSDKTGTLTKGEMNVRAILVGDTEYVVQGEGFDPAGSLKLGDAPVDLEADPGLREALVCGMLCNDAVLQREGDRWVVNGDPTEGALLVAGRRAGLDEADLRESLPRVGEIAFTSERKKMSTLHAPVPRGQLDDILKTPEDQRHVRLTDAGVVRLYVKGAPERVLAACTHQLVQGKRRELSEFDRKQIAYRNQEMATRALRVLGLAVREFPGEVPPIREEHLEKGLVFLGLIGMMDAPRADATRAIQMCKRAGIRVVMITGDHKLTAMAVAREMGILGPDERALTGEEFERLSDEDLIRDVEGIKVYARVLPEHKLRIVNAWKRRGHVVAMTGDGVNDAPALKRADLGISMGITGTDVAKESAEMVLTDDNFASIVAAVEEGRGIYENIRKFVAFLLSANAGEVLIMFFATLALSAAFLPFFEPVQLLWINLVTDGPPALALSADPYPKDIMERRPRDPKEGVLSREILGLIAVIAIILTVGTLGVFQLEIGMGATLEAARTMAFTVLVMFELFLVFALRSPRQTLWQIGLRSNRPLIYAVLASAALQLLVVYAPPLQAVFGTVPLGLQDWALVLGVAASAFLTVEALKVVRRRARAAA